MLLKLICKEHSTPVELVASGSDESTTVQDLIYQYEGHKASMHASMGEEGQNHEYVRQHMQHEGEMGWAA